VVDISPHLGEGLKRRGGGSKSPFHRKRDWERTHDDPPVENGIERFGPGLRTRKRLDREGFGDAWLGSGVSRNDKVT